MLLATPHAPWFGFATLYEAHINLPTANIYGTTFVGFPVLLIAFNDHLGWTYTANILDGCDTYLFTAAGATPDAETIVLVTDNLNTHTPACLYARFEPKHARSIASKLEWHYTPEHGSWLNMAECELSVLARQCLDRRMPDPQTLATEVAAWQTRRNTAHVTVDWHFTAADTRIKLKRLYPVLKEQIST